MVVTLVDEDAQVAFGQVLGQVMGATGRLYLEGELGAGKTTLCRGILRAHGHLGAVKSPTYTLVEMYELGDQRVHHLDLYRLADAEELEFIGGRELLDGNAICIVEWPSRGQGFLPDPDLKVILSVMETGRQARLSAVTATGQAWLDGLPLQSGFKDIAW